MIRNILTHPAYAGLRNHTQFIVAHYVPLGNGNTNKLPIDWRTGKPGNPPNIL